MNTKRVNTAADVIHRALTQNRTSAGIATALESAGLLMSPEKAAELERLRERFNAAPAVLSPEQRTALDEQLGDAKAATTGLIVSFGQSVANRRNHEHPTWEDLYCMNLSSYMGERMAPVLRRLLDAESRIAELEAAPVTVFRASHDSIILGRYRNKDAARLHCDTLMLREQPTAVLDWIEDDEDGIDELVATVGRKEIVTGYVVTALDVASEYDAEADE